MHTGSLGSTVTCAITTQAEVDKDGAKVKEAACFGVPLVKESWLSECEEKKTCALLRDHLLACSSSVRPIVFGLFVVVIKHFAAFLAVFVIVFGVGHWLSQIVEPSVNNAGPAAKRQNIGGPNPKTLVVKARFISLPPWLFNSFFCNAIPCWLVCVYRAGPRWRTLAGWLPLVTCWKKVTQYGTPRSLLLISTQTSTRTTSCRSSSSMAAYVWPRYKVAVVLQALTTSSFAFL